MKILQVTNFFKPSWESGGPARVAYGISKKLIERGHEVTVYTTDGFKSRLNVEKNKPVDVDGIRTYYFRNLSSHLARTMVLSIPYYSPIVARRELRDFDVIHIHEYRMVLAVVIRHYAKKYGVPYVIDPHGSVAPYTQKGRRFKNIVGQLFGYRILKDAYKVIAGTEMEIYEQKSMGVGDEKIVLILPGYDVSYFSDLPDPGQFREKFGIKEKKIILFLARIHKIKGIDFLVKSFSELIRNRDDIVLVIAGPDDGYKPTIKRLISELNISSNVLFTGVLDGKEKLSAYVDATMFIQPSKYERFCGSPFEAILCNTPIIVTKNTGCGDFVHKEDMGYTVDYGNVNELRNTMEEILNNLPEAHIKTQRCKQYIRSNLTWEKKIEKYEKLYQSAMEGTK